MQVQQGHPYLPYPSQGQSNTTHTNGHPYPETTAAAQSPVAGYTNGHHLNGDATAGDQNMYPYGQQPQHPSYGYQQQPQRYPPQNYPPPTLPPMQTAMGVHAPPPFSGPVPGSSAAAYAPQTAPHYSIGLPPPTHQQLPHMMSPPMTLPNHQQQAQEPELSRSGVKDDGYIYSLVVEQQPQRARMCGFGDKDRRPITPPPCIRLKILDPVTSREVNYDDIEGVFFVLQVDLWDEKAGHEVNIVRASSSSPAVSISTATTTSFPPTPDRPLLGDALYMAPDGRPFMAPAYRHPSMPTPNYHPAVYSQQLYPGAPIPIMPPTQSSSTMFTRNLIGSLTVNAAKLQDPNGKAGFWFVLQDLSVRTEGFFRLKMNFIDVGGSVPNSLNKGRAPVLAWIFSEKFQVYSAKKFPGVIESTALSKCFAAQGIKIPIRKDGKNEGKDDDGDGDD